MGQGYYRPLKTKRLIALLIRQGFVSAGGTKHGKYTRENGAESIIVPRHASLSSGTAKQICNTLEEEYHVPRRELKKLF